MERWPPPPQGPPGHLSAGTWRPHHVRERPGHQLVYRGAPSSSWVPVRSPGRPP
ncbi:hypothetical protein ACFFX0_09970 [Citricoccus parietis]|uniref:Uncharacterized protein n=1 Tax=Citricoccus parietis TaxID=592307 RepID=A0ABV5FXU2_9MICC